MGRSLHGGPRLSTNDIDPRDSPHIGAVALATISPVVLAFLGVVLCKRASSRAHAAVPMGSGTVLCIFAYHVVSAVSPLGNKWFTAVGRPQRVTLPLAPHMSTTNRTRYYTACTPKCSMRSLRTSYVKPVWNQQGVGRATATRFNSSLSECIVRAHVVEEREAARRRMLSHRARKQCTQSATNVPSPKYGERFMGSCDMLYVVSAGNRRCPWHTSTVAQRSRRTVL